MNGNELVADKTYTATSDEPDHVLIYLPGCQYGMDAASARKLRDSLNLAINAACLICDDCGAKKNSVEKSGCPDAIKHGQGKPATLCDECFNIRDQWTQL